MLQAMQNFIPIATTEAGLCLTPENWKEAKVDALSYSLEHLLYKPGLAVLEKISNLADYMAWDGQVILNASSLKANKEGHFLLKSPYDGAKINLSSTQLIALIQQLKPHAVILPEKIQRAQPDMWNHWNDSIFPFLSEEEPGLQEINRPHGVYFTCSKKSEWEHLDNWAHLPRYVMGNLDVQLIRDIREKGIQFIETNEPAHKAMGGVVYNQEGELDLVNSTAAMQFKTIDNNCTCPVCMQKFTRAYFHHLFQHTPLLCYRFLIQHNVFWMAN